MATWKNSEKRREYNREYVKRRMANDPAWAEERKRRRREYEARKRAESGQYSKRPTVWKNNHPNTLRIRQAKETPCLDCGILLPPEIMELDHVRGEKKFGLCTTETTRKWCTLEMVEEEIQKCDVRCPNCHRLRHYYERIEIRKREWEGFQEAYVPPQEFQLKLVA